MEGSLEEVTFELDLKGEQELANEQQRTEVTAYAKRPWKEKALGLFQEQKGWYG